LLDVILSSFFLTGYRARKRPGLAYRRGSGHTSDYESETMRHRTRPSFRQQFFQISKIPTLPQKIKFVLSLHFSIEKSRVFPKKLSKFGDEKTKKNIYLMFFLKKTLFQKMKKLKKKFKKKKKKLIIFFVFWK